MKNTSLLLPRAQQNGAKRFLADHVTLCFPDLDDVAKFSFIFRRNELTRTGSRVTLTEVNRNPNFLATMLSNEEPFTSDGLPFPFLKYKIVKIYLFSVIKRNLSETLKWTVETYFQKESACSFPAVAKSPKPS